MKLILIVIRIIGTLACLAMGVLLGLWLLIPFQPRMHHESEYLQYGTDFNQWSTGPMIGPISRWNVYFWGLVVLILIWTILELMHRARWALKMRSVRKGGCVNCGYIPGKEYELCPQCNQPLAGQTIIVQKLIFRMKLVRALGCVVIFISGAAMLTGLVLRIIGEISEHPIEPP